VTKNSLANHLSDTNCVLQDLQRLNFGVADFKDFIKYDIVSSLDELISHPPYHTLMLSLCKTSQFQEVGEAVEEIDQSIFGNPRLIDFIESKYSQQLIVFGKKESLNQLWSHALFKVHPCELIEI